MLYPLFILFLLLLLYYHVTNVTYEAFFIDNNKNKKKAVDSVKKIKQMLQDSQKEQVVVIVPSIDSEVDKNVNAMVKNYFSDSIVTMVTFTNSNLINEFILNLTTESPTTFPAYYRLNKSEAQNSYMNAIKDRPSTISNINKEYKKLKDNASNKKDNKKDKKKDKKKKKKK